jgi:AmmeMemoRadiSam system protein A
MKEMMLLNADLQRKLLQIARETLQTYLSDKKILTRSIIGPELVEKNGIFVTLKKGDALRGCVGEIEATDSLYKLTQEIAIAAATRDPRFPPLVEEELNEVDIEISVLSPFEKISDPESIRIGSHGLFVKKGRFSGLLLPQVATTYKLGPLTFLEQTCRKAWLDKDAWKDPKVEIYVFTAQVFGEKHSVL